MFAKNLKLKSVVVSSIFACLALTGGARAMAAGTPPVRMPAASGPVDWQQLPLPACPMDRRGGGDGHSPDPLSVFNQVVELADGEAYLLRGTVDVSGQPTFVIDLEAHPWLANAKRKASPYYAIEGTKRYWRDYDGAYGELAATAHVQFKMGVDGQMHQVITLKPIPELSLIPRHAPAAEDASGIF